MDNHEFSKEFGYHFIDEMCYAISHHLNGTSKTGHDFFINELSGAMGIELANDSSFNPFCKLIHS